MSLIVTQSTVVGPNIVPTDMVLYLDAYNMSSYPGGGSTWYDISGNGNDFTLINSPTYTGNSLRFNQSGYTQRGLCTNYTFGDWGTGSFTVEYVINVTGTGGGSTSGYAACVLMKRGSGTANGGNGFAITQGTAAKNGGVFRIQTVGGEQVIVQNQAAYQDSTVNQTIHVTNILERNAQGAANTGSLYVNGVKKVGFNYATFTQVNKSIERPTVQASLMYTYGELTYVAGDLYLVRAYNKALTPLQVYQNFDATRYRYGI